MRKAIVIIFFVVIAFVVEFILFNTIGRWIVPNVLLLLVMFFDLYFGIRYGLFTAVLAGVLKDSFGTNILGLHVSSLIICAYMTTILKRYIYHMGSYLSRYILIFFVAAINVVAYGCLYQIFGGNILFWDVFRFVLIPEVVMTLLVAPVVFRELKRCVSGLFV
jgi:rod shape-determining protein MreD